MSSTSKYDLTRYYLLRAKEKWENEQRQVMRSVGLSGLMGAALALEHCA